MADVMLDAGVLIELERRNRDARLWWDEAVRRQDVLMTTSVTIAEVWRGYGRGRNWELRQILNAIDALRVGKEQGEEAGELLAEAGMGRQHVPDAILVVAARRRGADVISYDKGDVWLLASYVGVPAYSVR